MSSATVGMLKSVAANSKWQYTSEKEEADRKTLSDSSWADGLRGIAALLVMSSHMTLAIARYITRPGNSEDGPSYLLQRPIFRLVGQGASWVAVFVILSGFVNTLRPVKLSRTGQLDAALSNLAPSFLRRNFRLFLPSFVATVIAWFFCQLGAFEMGRNSDAYWLAITSPYRSATWGGAIDDLIRAVRDTWLFDPENRYDQPQWALLYLALGSLYCFALMLMFIHLTPKWRTICLTGTWFLAWNWDLRLKAPLIAVGIVAGMLLTELHHSEIPFRCSRYSIFYTPPLTFLGLFLMSFPSDFHNMQAWTRNLRRLDGVFFPSGAFPDRNFPTMGAVLLCFSAVMSPYLRKLLSRRPMLWLGKLSFPIYLLHGPLMRSVFAWMLFARQDMVEMEEGKGQDAHVVMKYPLPGSMTIGVALVTYMAILLFTAHMWATKLEPHFGAITKMAEDIMTGKREAAKPAVLPVRQD